MEGLCLKNSALVSQEPTINYIFGSRFYICMASTTVKVLKFLIISDIFVHKAKITFCEISE